MKPGEFTKNKTGKIIKIDGLAGESHAFIPDPLPLRRNFSETTWRLLADSSAALGSLNGVGKYLPNPHLLLSPIQRREAQISSELEGTITNPRQQLLFDFDMLDNKDIEDEQGLREVSNYQKALNYFIDNQDKLPISLKLIRKLHEILMQGVRGFDKEPGQFRRIPVQIGRPARFIPPPPNNYKQPLYELERYIHAKKNIPPLIDAFLVHYQFEAIHPFRDGNGRVGRILLAIMIAEGQGMTHSWLYMSSFFNAHKDEYLNRLFQISADGQWDEWVNFCLEGVVQQAQDTEKRFDRLVYLSRDFKERINQVGGSHRLHAIADNLFVIPVVQPARLAEQYSINYRTARSDIDKLVKVGILSEVPDTRPMTYFNADIFSLIFEDI